MEAIHKQGPSKMAMASLVMLILGKFERKGMRESFETLT
jgi:hypothetical protein